MTKVPHQEAFYLLVAIVILSLATTGAGLALLLAGHRDDVPVLLTVVGPVLAALLALKQDAVRRQIATRVQEVKEVTEEGNSDVAEVYRLVNGGYDKTLATYTHDKFHEVKTDLGTISNRQEVLRLETAKAHDRLLAEIADLKARLPSSVTPR